MEKYKTSQYSAITDSMTEYIKAVAARSAWGKGVKKYAIEITQTISEHVEHCGVFPATVQELKAVALNGAKDWIDYSYGGNSLIYDGDIAERLCCPSELRRTKGGERNPNSYETCLDVQARALAQAFVIVRRAWRSVTNN